MSCEKCKNTCCILEGEVKLHGKPLNVLLRLDLDEEGHAEIDINIVQYDSIGSPNGVSKWTHSEQISYCPFCGRTL